MPLVSQYHYPRRGEPPLFVLKKGDILDETENNDIFVVNFVVMAFIRG
jgi:hypothetical protein